MSDSKEVATTPAPGTNLPVSAAMLDRFAKLAGAGFEHAGKGDYALPFIGVLQKMSPQVDKKDPKYVTGAEPGMMINSVTNELFDGDQGVLIIPVEFRKVYLEWVPRDKGGGLKGEYLTREDAEARKQEDTVIADTANHYVLLKTGLGYEAVLVSCTSTKLKFSRNFMSQMSRVKINGTPAPMFAKKYILKTVSQENAKGTFYNLKVEVIDGPDGWVNAQELDAAEQFYNQIRSGKRGADFSKIDEEPSILAEDPTEAGAPAF